MLKRNTHILFYAEKWIFSALFFLFSALSAFATHNRAGEILYQHLSGFTYEITIVTYTKESSVSADRDSLPIVWGDNTSDTLPRTNGPVVGGNHKGVGIGNDIKYNLYVGIHTYPGYGTYVMSMTDPNRIDGIVNINNGASVDEPFYIEDSLFILDPQFYSYDNSPILLDPPIDFGNVFQTYIHNPNAYDPDGDSLSYSFIVPRKAANVPVENYVDPNKTIGTPPNETFTIDHITGQVTWAVPVAQGIYNFAVLVREYRNGRCIGTMVRDMEVIVDALNDHPPVLGPIRDTCVIAGSQLLLNISATDPDTGQSVVLFSNGGPYEVATNPATFSYQSGPQSAHGTFTWNTSCDHVRKDFYQVIFKAQDTYGVTPLVDIENWLITVVAPPPQNVIASTVGNDIQINWAQPYTCGSTALFTGFSVWRREASNPFIPGNCDRGLAGQGYTKIADHLMTYQFTDSNVIRGKDYCYRVVAEFADRTPPPADFYFNQTESLPSNESCAELKKNVPIITNVSVTNTDVAAGTIYVAWTKPRIPDLDTIQNPAPYKYVVSRANQNAPSSFARIDSFTAVNFVALNDSQFSDHNLNTQDLFYIYKVGFYSNNNFIGETNPASSVFLHANGNDRKVILTWQESVPWLNASHTIYKKDDAGQFDSIGISVTSFFVDTGLVNKQNYCYYAKSTGHYTVTGLPDPLFNNSQITCATPVDTARPCPPQLQVLNECNTGTFTFGAFTNQLLWQNTSIPCSFDIAKYLIYFSADASLPLTVIDSVLNRDSTSYFHHQPNTLNGCYAVAAADSDGNLSNLSNEVCVNSCPKYQLPNVFTPNGDQHNDVYHPILPVQFIDKVDMQIFDQWGTLVFKTSDIMINWNGTDIKTGKQLPDGTYYYVCKPFENSVQVLPTLSGYIHLLR